MQLLSSWKDSLSIFKPANFKLFCLVTLKSLIETYKVWLKYWGWLIGTFFIIEYFWAQFPVTNGLDFFAMGPVNLLNMGPLIISPLLVVKSCLIMLITFTLFLSARASTMTKNFRYFAEYALYLFYFVIWFLLLPLLWIGIFRGIQYISPAFAFNYGQILFFIIYFFASVTSVLYTLFLLDSDGSFSAPAKEIWRAIKMYLFNFPFYLLVFAIMVLFFVIIGLGLSFVAKYSGNWNFAIYNLGGVIFNILLFMPLLVCIITNFYIKRVHEQFQLYYGNHIKE